MANRLVLGEQCGYVVRKPRILLTQRRQPLRPFVHGQVQRLVETLGHGTPSIGIELWH